MIHFVTDATCKVEEDLVVTEAAAVVLGVEVGSEEAVAVWAEEEAVAAASNVRYLQDLTTNS
jgi:hypothetical protein